MKLPLFIIALTLSASALGQGMYVEFAHSVRLNYLRDGVVGLRFMIPVEIPLPKYDFEMLRAGLQGSVEAQFFVDSKGLVQNLVIKKATQKGFGNAVKETVSKWKFLPSKNVDSQHRTINCKFTFSCDDE